MVVIYCPNGYALDASANAWLRQAPSAETSGQHQWTPTNGHPNFNWICSPQFNSICADQLSVCWFKLSHNFSSRTLPSGHDCRMPTGELARLNILFYFGKGCTSMFHNSCVHIDWSMQKPNYLSIELSIHPSCLNPIYKHTLLLVIFERIAAYKLLIQFLVGGSSRYKVDGHGHVLLLSLLATNNLISGVDKPMVLHHVTLVIFMR